MRKVIIILISCIVTLTGFTQKGISEKDLKNKYKLPENFFDPAYPAKEYIISHFDNLTIPGGKKITPPEDLVSGAGHLFVLKKMFNKAFVFFKMNVDNYPKNMQWYMDIGDYYKAVGDKERAFVYYARSLNVKYRQPVSILDALPDIDSLITAEYRNLSKQTDRIMLPPQYLVADLAFAFLDIKNTDKAFTLFTLNYKNYPRDYEAIDDMGDYYENIGDSAKAFSFWAKALTLQYHLTDSFFTAAYNPAFYFKSYYKDSSDKIGKTVSPPERLMNSLGFVFMVAKKFDKAEPLLKMNIDNYPKNPFNYFAMREYFASTGDSLKAEEFNKLGEALSVSGQPGIGNRRRIVIADTAYDTHIASPICRENCPTVLFDEAHDNYHKASGRYKPFANLMANDGFKIILGKSTISNESLSTADVVVIAGPGKITNEELSILNHWIRNGGSLLTITDHNNFNFDGLLESVGVQTPETEFTEDPLHARVLEDGINKNPRHIVFSEKDKMLGDHPIINGRNASEKIRVVKTFSGRTIIGPPGSTVLLCLSQSAVDYLTIDPGQRSVKASVSVKCKGERAYGVAFNLGKGKVVVVSEAAMLTAQLWAPDFTPDAGMNVPGSDDRQFAINIMRWLAGYLK